MRLFSGNFYKLPTETHHLWRGPINDLVVVVAGENMNARSRKALLGALLGIFAGTITHLLSGQIFGYIFFPIISAIAFAMKDT